MVHRTAVYGHLLAGMMTPIAFASLARQHSGSAGATYSPSAQPLRHHTHWWAQSVHATSSQHKLLCHLLEEVSTNYLELVLRRHGLQCNRTTLPIRVLAWHRCCTVLADPSSQDTMAPPTNGSWLTKLKNIDAYPKTIEEFKVRTMQGGIFSMVAFVAITILLVSEVSYYFTTDTVDKMLVDGKRDTVVPIYFEVDFPKMPCSIVAVEKSDMSGAVQHDILNNIEKIALDRSGRPYKEGVRDTMGGALTNHTDLHEVTEKPACGPCYSAGDEGQCCNTCDDVKAAYAKKNWHLPSLHTISQCQEAEIERVLRGEISEGCRIKGFLLVGKVAGKVYFAPSKYFRNGYLSAQDLVDATFRAFDTSHRINSFSFGESFPNMKNPLDKREKMLSDNTRGSFQYFLKVVPTDYSFLSGNRIITNQFSVTEHFKELSPLSEKGLPMVTLTYSFSPIMFRIEEVRKGFLQFLTSVCAIVGGIFTIMGVLDSLAFSILNKPRSNLL